MWDLKGCECSSKNDNKIKYWVVVSNFVTLNQNACSDIAESVSNDLFEKWNDE